MAGRITSFAAAVALAGALVGGASADASVPDKARSVSVTRHKITSGIDVTLGRAGAVSGTVVGPGSDPISTRVWVFSSDGTRVVKTSSDDSGHYRANILSPAGRYVVCATGYGYDAVSGLDYPLVGQCSGHVAYAGGKPPRTATRITAHAGSEVTGVNLALKPTAFIKGFVHPAGKSRGLREVEVTITNRSTGRAVTGYTHLSGHYRLNAPGASKRGFAVCFHINEYNAAYVPVGGYQNQCWKRVPVVGKSVRGADAVHVRPGHVRSGIDAALHRGGAISGKLTTTTGVPLRGNRVEIFSAAGTHVRTVHTTGRGNYLAMGLPAATAYRVCAPVGNYPSGLPPDTGSTLPECYRSTRWSGGAVPPGAQPVSVHRGKVTRHVDVAVTGQRRAQLRGSVAAPDGTGLPGATVEIFTAHGSHPVDQFRTTGSGAFAAFLPLSSAGYRVCASGYSADGAAGTPATGFGPRCVGAAWDGGPPPKGATRFPLGVHSGKPANIVLIAAGAISGTARPAAGSGSHVHVFADVFDKTGHAVAQARTSQRTGDYRITGLAPGDYRVCFEVRYSKSFSYHDGFGYAPECYRDAPWTRLSGALG